MLSICVIYYDIIFGLKNWSYRILLLFTMVYRITDYVIRSRTIMQILLIEKSKKV